MSDDIVKKKKRNRRGRPKKLGRPLNYYKRWYRKNRAVKKKRKVRCDKGKRRLSYVRKNPIEKKPKEVKQKVVKPVEKKGRRSKLIAFVDYDIAQVLVRRAGITSAAKYKKWRKEERVLALPAIPEIYYPQWTTWGDFLGVHNNPFGYKKKPYRPFWEAVRFAQKICAEHQITTSQMWKEKWDAIGMPDDIPRQPNQAYKDDWQGWDVWLGRSALAKLNAMKEVVGVVALCSVPDYPTNYIKVVIAEDGEEQLREKLRQYEGKALKLYVWQQGTKQNFNNTLSRFTSPQGDGILLVPNINQLIFELDNVMDWFKPNSGIRVG